MELFIIVLDKVLYVQLLMNILGLKFNNVQDKYTYDPLLGHFFEIDFAPESSR